MDLPEASSSSAAAAAEPPPPAGAGVRCWRAWGGAAGLLLLLYPWVRTSWPGWPGSVVTVYASALRDALVPLAAALLLGRLLLAGRGRPLIAAGERLGHAGRLGLLALGALLVWGVLSSLAAAEPFSAGLGLWWLFLWSLCAAAGALVLAAPCRRAGALRALGLSGALTGGLAGLWWLLEAEWAMYVSATVEFPFSMPAALALFCLAGSLAGLGCALTAPSRRGRAGWGAASLLGAAGVLAAGTLAGLAGLGGGLWLLAVRLLPRRARRGLLILSGLALLAAAVWGVWYLDSPAGRRQMYRTSWGTRPLYLQTAAELGLTRPLTGWGPGTFAHGWSVEAPPRVILHAARAGWTFAAHCEPAQVVAELGLPGLLLWVGVVSAAVAGAWRASRDRDGRADRGGLPLLLVLGGLLCDGLFSPAYRHMDTGFLFAFLLGGGLAGWARREATAAATPAPGPPVWSRVLGVALLTVLAGRAVVGVQAQLLLGRALRHGTAGAYDDAAEKARRAAGLALDLPLWRRCQQTLARAELHRGEHAAAAAAAEELRRVLPAHPRALDLLLQATYELGEPKLYFRRRIVALRYRSFDPDLRAGLHRFLARLEPAALARWRAELGAAEAPLSWLTEADWNLLAAIVHFDGEGDPDAALSRVAELRPEEARLLPLRAESGRLLTLLGMEEQAAGVLAPAAEVIPPDPVALYWLAVVRARQGRMEKAGALLAECLAWDPDLPEAAIAYSRYLLARGDAAGRQAAPGVLRQAIARRPGHVDLRVALVRTLWSLGRRDAARRALAAALDRLPAAEALMDLRRSLPPPGPTGELKSD